MWILCHSYDYTQKGQIEEQLPKKSVGILLTTVYQQMTDGQPTDDHQWADKWPTAVHQFYPKKKRVYHTVQFDVFVGLHGCFFHWVFPNGFLFWFSSSERECDFHKGLDLE